MADLEAALQYPGISAQGFAHPADRAARAAFHSVPMLDTAIKRFTELSYERRLRQVLLGSAVRVGDDQLPALWSEQQRCAHVLDVEHCPMLYVTQQPIGNALTVGASDPVTLVASALATSFSEEDRRAVLAHEMGHVLADHAALTTALELVTLVLGGAMRLQPIAGIPLFAIYRSLREWSWAAELTADRASALVVADPRATCATLMRMAGGPVAGMNLDAFIRQATEYEEEPDVLARWSRFFTESSRSHPFPVRRVRELVAWVASGDYDRIRSGQYVRRGQEPPASEEYASALNHYRERFTRIVERAGSGIATVFDRVSSWIGGRAHAESDDDDGE